MALRTIRLLTTAVVAGTLVGVSLHQRLDDAPSTTAAGCRPGLWHVYGVARSDGSPIYVVCVRPRRGPSRTTRIDLRYGRALSLTVGTQTVAICWSPRDWIRISVIAERTLGEPTARTGGFIWRGQHVVNLPTRLCRYLDQVVYRRDLAVNRSTAWAFKNLTHEGLHVAGVDDESTTECYAIQMMTTTIARLGLSGEYAKQVAAVSARRYPRIRKLEPRYYSAACRNGGLLDLSPQRKSWP